MQANKQSRSALSAMQATQQQQQININFQKLKKRKAKAKQYAAQWWKVTSTGTVFQLLPKNEIEGDAIKFDYYYQHYSPYRFNQTARKICRLTRALELPHLCTYVCMCIYVHMDDVCKSACCCCFAEEMPALV